MLPLNARETQPTQPAPIGKPLHGDDYRSLAARWISKELADMAQLRRVTSIEGVELLGKKTGDYAGIFIPYLRPNGERYPAYRLRRDNPDMRRKGSVLKAEEKYSQPPGQRNFLYFPPCNHTHLLDPDLPVVVTEGEFKCLALWRLAQHESKHYPRFLPVALGGVWNFLGKSGITSTANGQRSPEKDLISDFDLLDWVNRKVAIAFDADIKENEQVKGARAKLTRELQSRGARVAYLEWDARIAEGAKGIDDLLAAAGPEIVLRLYTALEGTYKSRKPANDGPFKLTDNRVLYTGSSEHAVPICARLEILARARDNNGGSWGLVLKWKDWDGDTHEWICPQDLVIGDGADLCRYLSLNGLWINQGSQAKRLFLQYLNSAETDERILCTDRGGWHDETFVLPRQVIGAQANGLRLNSSATIEAHINERGTLAQWQEGVAKLCLNNSRLILSVCAAFAGPCLHLSATESGGLHFWGTDSKGKSTALYAGGSVIGGGGKLGFAHSWHNTMNGLEAIAASHNDLTLYLDELAQLDAREAGETAYLLANGIGKGRMNKSLTQRGKLSWTLLFVSAGEVTLADHLGSVGKQTKGGMEVRLLNIPADAGRGWGLFEDIHGVSDPATFSRKIRENSQRYFGTALPAFLEWLTEHIDQARTELKTARQKSGSTMGVKPEAAGGVYRAAERLAVIGAAGELAIAAGIVPWPKGHAAAAAKTCFDAWLQLRGHSAAADDNNALRRLRLFLAKDAARFQRTSGAVPNNRAGFVTTNAAGETVFQIIAEVWRNEICQAAGVNPDRMATLCKEAGYLDAYDKDRLSLSVRTFDYKGRAYAINGAILEDEE